MLVHGAWHGDWAWDPLLSHLQHAGIDARAVQLAGVDRGPGRHDLAGHVAALRAEIDAAGRPVVLCGHSYGGAVMTEAAAGAPDVAHLVYVAAFQLAEGESCVDANVPPPTYPDGIGPVLDGEYLTVAADTARHMFYDGCPPGAVAAAIERLTPEHVGTVGSPVRAAAWRDVPSTYVVCARDRALPPAAQHRMAERATTRHVLDHAHSPMLGIPAELAALLVDAVHGSTPGRFAPTGTAPTGTAAGSGDEE
jgi:pimeloyl-ACP methyl ester carboxylesterase